MELSLGSIDSIIFFILIIRTHNKNYHIKDVYNLLNNVTINYYLLSRK